MTNNESFQEIVKEIIAKTERERSRSGANWVVTEETTPLHEEMQALVKEQKRLKKKIKKLKRTNNYLLDELADARRPDGTVVGRG
jgi:predicted RNase H-like nuclease (RuvC/YqgF family)